MSIEYDFDLDFGALHTAPEAARPVALARAGEHIRGTAAPLTPVRDGNLIGSAFVRVVGEECQVGYPGPYARRQHFELTWRHTVGQALYLEQPMISEADKAIQIMADTLREAMP
jgi:hypothetical protein